MSEEIERAVLQELQHHIGRENGVNGYSLTVRIFGEDCSSSAERSLRKAIEALRRSGSHICGSPKEGYYMAATAEELDATCNFLYKRSMNSLSQIAAMKHVAEPDLKGQLNLPT